ncbi:hypothetical protein X737_02210 [Mesorhizobium sp. L48C026A00]|nr:hypothetical protein X737_02210 [Mesorhizobium sp. L48C026A00]
MAKAGRPAEQPATCNSIERGLMISTGTLSPKLKPRMIADFETFRAGS